MKNFINNIKLRRDAFCWGYFHYFLKKDIKGNNKEKMLVAHRYTTLTILFIAITIMEIVLIVNL